MDSRNFYSSKNTPENHQGKSIYLVGDLVGQTPILRATEKDNFTRALPLNLSPNRALKKPTHPPISSHSSTSNNHLLRAASSNNLSRIPFRIGISQLSYH